MRCYSRSLPMSLCVLTTSLTLSLWGGRGIAPQYLFVCHMNENLMDEKNCRRVLCGELDSYGGQPVVQGKIGEQVDAWMLANFSQLPNGYLKTLPKMNLAQDKVKKDRQDECFAVLSQQDKPNHVRICTIDEINPSAKLSL